MREFGHPRDRTVTAVLGPTNTGKTHYAIERMLGHRSGVIGLPLRLLAREVYDRIVALRGPSVVALVTGEERIVPPRTQWWVCTVEAMPLEIGADFVAVDEIQLCADPDRGHVFTDRLLNARGLHETLLIGSEAMRPRIASLIPKAQFLRRERFSTLTYAGSKKLSRLPDRSAIVAFSVDAVYTIAELIRRQRGGAAVVMGALSPRTRNAQVELYQNGDVDFMVATDAIGMGLNLDVTHVAFAGVTKFDGDRHRRLHPMEMGQIAGRAGRHTTDGTFGVTGETGPLDDDLVEAITSHRFAPVSRLSWRNTRLDFGSAPALIASLEVSPGHADLMRAREADDLAALRALAEVPEVRATLTGGPEVRRLWDVCQVPDFRKVSPQEHAALLTRIYQFLVTGPGCISSDWLAGQVQRIDRADGDIDAISKRLAYIRTWTYVAQRAGWVEGGEHWQGETRAVEDRLSDALHGRLTQRFVDRRTSVLMRRLKQRESLVAEVSDTGDVTVEGQFVGRLEGFQFRTDPAASGDEARMLRTASLSALQVELNRRADRFYNAPDTEIGLTEQGGLMWGEHAVGRLAPGADVLTPDLRAFVDENADPAVAEKVTRRLTHWINRRIAAQFEGLLALKNDETVTGLARGIAFRLVEALGIVPRSEVAADVKSLDQDGRGMLRRHGVRFGQYTVFQQAVLKPAPTQLRLVLWSLTAGIEEFPSAPPPGLVTIPAVIGAPPGYYPRAGYHLAGTRAIRIDMLERLADQIRTRDTRAGFEAGPDMLSITGLTMDQFADLMQGLGYRAEKTERPKQKPAPRVVSKAALPKPVEVAAAGDDAPVAVDPLAQADVAQGQADDAGMPDVRPEVEISGTGEPAIVPIAEPAPDVVAPEAGTSPEVGAETPAMAAGGSVSPESSPPSPSPPSPESAAPGSSAPEPTTPDPAVPVEMETVYSFVWAPARSAGPRHRSGPPRGGEGGQRRGPDGPRAEGGATDAQPGQALAGDAPRQDGPRRDGPRHDGPRRDGGRHDGPRRDGPRQDGPRADSGNHARHGSPRASDPAAPSPADPVATAPRPREDQPPRRAEAIRTESGTRPGDGARPPRRDHDGKPGSKGKGRPRDEDGEAKSKVYSARPPKSDKPIDPDNPFAALLALKLTKD